jgi:hypothetical protein
MKFYYKTDEVLGSNDASNPKVNFSWLPWVLGIIAAVFVFKPGLLKKLNPFHKKTS